MNKRTKPQTRPVFELDDGIPGNTPDVLGVWSKPAQAGAVSFGTRSGARAARLKPPIWRANLSSDPQVLAQELTYLDESNNETKQALSQAEIRLSRYAQAKPSAGGYTYGSPAAQWGEPERALDRLLGPARSRVTFFDVRDFIPGWKEAIRDFQQWLEQMELHLQYAHVETNVAGMRIAVTQVNWAGDFGTQFATGVDAAQVKTHLEALARQLTTRQQLLEQLAVVARLAATLAIIGANPALAPIAALKFLQQFLEEVRKRIT